MKTRVIVLLSFLNVFFLVSCRNPMGEDDAIPEKVSNESQIQGTWSFLSAEADIKFKSGLLALDSLRWRASEPYQDKDGIYDRHIRVETGIIDSSRFEQQLTISADLIVDSRVSKKENAVSLAALRFASDSIGYAIENGVFKLDTCIVMIPCELGKREITGELHHDTLLVTIETRVKTQDICGVSIPPIHSVETIRFVREDDLQLRDLRPEDCSEISCNWEEHSFSTGYIMSDYLTFLGWLCS